MCEFDGALGHNPVGLERREAVIWVSPMDLIGDLRLWLKSPVISRWLCQES
jgi:hypothetical protein